jgi:NADH dehydrogenase FAD-containing subunit
VFSIGDCNFIEDYALPATAQVASQQGSYLGRLFSKGYQMGSYSPSKPPYKFMVRTANTQSVNIKETKPVQSPEELYPSEKLRIGRLGVSIEMDKPMATSMTTVSCFSISTVY